MNIAQQTFRWIFHGAALSSILVLCARLQQIGAMSAQHENCLPQRHDPQIRFTPDEPSTTFAYPSKGGIVIGQRLTAVELQYLNIFRFEPSYRALNVTEEDEFAFDLMRLGADWFSDWNVFWRHTEAMTAEYMPYGFHYPPVVHTAYPSTGGVWMLKHSADRTSWSKGLDHALQELTLLEEPDHLRSMLSLCLSMDERSHVLEKFGGVFFGDAHNCTDLPSSLDAGIQVGQRYAVLLEKMDDMNYVDRWLNSFD